MPISREQEAREQLIAENERLIEALQRIAGTSQSMVINAADGFVRCRAIAAKALDESHMSKAKERSTTPHEVEGLAMATIVEGDVMFTTVRYKSDEMIFPTYGNVRLTLIPHKE